MTRLGKRTLQLAIISANIAFLIVIPFVSAPPVVLPYAINGVISMNGRPVPDQLLFEAKINHLTYAATYTRNGGFGLDPVFKVPADQPDTERIEGGKDGDLVELYLDGVKIAETVFQSGRINKLVIEVGDKINSAPTAFFRYIGGVTGFSMRFDGSQSIDSDGDDLTYSWDFGDGHTSTLVEPIHTYEASGEHRVSLHVRDAYGLTAQQSQTVDVRPLPEPEYWQLINLDDGAQKAFYSDETWLKIFVKALEPTQITIIRYDSVFMVDDSVALSSQNLWSLSSLYSSVVSQPIYLEIPVAELGEIHPSTMLYAWRDGGWSVCPHSGVSMNGLWAYVSGPELGEGLLALGISDGYVRLNLQAVQQSGEPGRFLCKVDITSIGFEGEYSVFLRVDGDLLSMEQVVLKKGDAKTLELFFAAEPGTHLISVNGAELELRVASPLNSLLIVGLGLFPLSLISMFMKRNF